MECIFLPPARWKGGWWKRGGVDVPCNTELPWGKTVPGPSDVQICFTNNDIPIKKDWSWWHLYTQQLIRHSAKTSQSCIISSQILRTHNQERAIARSTYLLWQCRSKSMIKVCHAFSLLSVSRVVGVRAKHNVITSKASQHTCSSSPSGSLAAFV